METLYVDVFAGGCQLPIAGEIKVLLTKVADSYDLNGIVSLLPFKQHGYLRMLQQVKPLPRLEKPLPQLHLQL